MISYERLEFKLKNPDICTGDEFEMAKELLALRQAREGWKLVPTEATEEMIQAGDLWCDGLTYLSRAYEAMLEASPEPK